MGKRLEDAIQPKEMLSYARRKKQYQIRLHHEWKQHREGKGREGLGRLDGGQSQTVQAMQNRGTICQLRSRPIKQSVPLPKGELLVPLYKMFVRPKLEHAVAAWSPWMEGDKEVMEKVQRRLIRMISDKKGNSYEERLQSVGLTSLGERRERGDMIQTFRAMKGLDNVEKSNWFQFRQLENARATRSTVTVDESGQQERENVLFMESVRVDTRKNFFTVRVVNQWNQLPDEIKSQKTVIVFKRRYDEWKEQPQPIRT